MKELGVSRAFQKYFKELLRRFQESLQAVSGKVEGHFEKALWTFQGSYRVFQRSSKNILLVFHKCFNPHRTGVSESLIRGWGGAMAHKRKTTI